jgi:hypothetical protein
MTVLDAFDLAACDDAQPGRRAAAGDAQAFSSCATPRILGDLRDYSRDATAAIGCSQMQVSRIITTSLERLSAHVSMACGGSSTSDTTEGATA